MADAKTFAVTLDRFGAKTEVEVTRAVRGIVRDLHRRIVERTPVRTGFLRANWRVSIGTPGAALTEPEASRPVRSAEQATQVALRTAAIIDQLRLTDAAYISNAASYGPQVESGGPRNAPHSMVALSIAEITALLRSGLPLP
jgi:hypothetical protein